MAKRHSFEVPFPLGGIDEKHAYRKQPPFTTPDAENVRGTETIDGRLRGGQRPGMEKAYSEGSSSEPIRCLTQVTSVGLADGTGFFYYWSDQFNRTASITGPGWFTMPVLGQSQIPTTRSASMSVNRQIGAAVLMPLEYSISSPYIVGALIDPWRGSIKGKFRIYARMDDSSPDPTDQGIVAELIINDAAYSGSLVSYSGGVATTYAFTSGSHAGVSAGWFDVNVTGNTVTCYWRGSVLVSQNVDGHTGKRVGIGGESQGSYPVNAWRVGAFRVDGTPENDYSTQRRRTYLVKIANAALSYEKTIGSLTQVSSNGVNFSQDHMIRAAEREQQLYIADWDPPRIMGTGGTIDATGYELDKAGINWGLRNININNDVVVITNGTGDVTNGTYKIASLGAVCMLATPAGGAGTCDFRISRAPKIFNPASEEMTIWTASAGLGQVPNDCRLIVLYRDRLIAGGDDNAPHEWYACRQGAPADWNYNPADPNDPGRAIQGSNSDAGLTGDSLTALISYSDDFVLFGCMNSIWVLRGDPAWGGTLDALTYEIGVISAGGFCQGPEGEVYLLAHEGLYVVPPGADAKPVALSPRTIPEQLKSIPPGTTEAQLAWNDQQRGIHIFLTSTPDTAPKARRAPTSSSSSRSSSSSSCSCSASCSSSSSSLSST